MLSNVRRIAFFSPVFAGGFFSEVVRLNSAKVTRLLSLIPGELCLNDEAGWG